MKTIYTLTSELRNKIDWNFKVRMSQSDMLSDINKWFDNTMLTASGKRRYPHYYQTALNAFNFEYMRVKADENTIFCYDVNGTLCTTYNAERPDSYSFKGTTDIINYRKAGIADSILHQCDNGYYYPCGKPYFVRTKL